VLPDRAALQDQPDSFDLARQIQAENGPGQAAPEYLTVTQQYVQPGEDPDPGDPVPGLEDIEQMRTESQTSGLGEGIRIAVLDTGVDGVISRVIRADKQVHDHQDVDELRDPSRVRPSSTGLTVLGPAAGHGTHIAGLIHCVAPNAVVISIKVACPLGVASESDLAAGIERALAADANIINLSLGGYAFVENSRWPTLAAFGLLEQAIAKVPPNIAIVAAAGNCGSNAPFYPAAFHERVVGVAALTTKDRLWDQSNYGDWVRACARGVGLRSIFVQGEEDPEFVPDTPDIFPNDLNYATWSGTSFAAPLVAAQIAIVAHALNLAHDTNQAAQLLLAMSSEPLGRRPCGKRILVNVPGQT
jgi:subtilisin family serine protease